MLKTGLPGRTRSASRPDPPCQKRSARAPNDFPLGRHPKPSAGEAIPGKCPKRGFLSRPRTRSASRPSTCLYHGTEQATTVVREGSRPLVLATTQPRRNRRQQNFKMGKGRRTRRRAPGLCGGGGAATPWPVGISGGHARDPSRRRFRPVCPYGAGRGLPRPADALSTWPMGDAAPLSVGGHALCAGSASGGSPMPSSGRR